VRVHDLNRMLLRAYLEADDRIVLPPADDAMLEVWRTGVEEVRSRLDGGWR
jgi:hypothetical protein